jgi:hypothetical protein
MKIFPMSHFFPSLVGGRKKSRERSKNSDSLVYDDVMYFFDVVKRHAKIVYSERNDVLREGGNGGKLQDTRCGVSITFFQLKG